MNGRSNVRPAARPMPTNNRTMVRMPVNTGGTGNGSMGRSQPVARGPPGRYEDESPPPSSQTRYAGKQQKPAGGGGGRMAERSVQQRGNAYYDDNDDAPLPVNSSKRGGGSGGRMPERSAPQRGNNDLDDTPISSTKRGGGGPSAYSSNGSSGGGGLYPCSVCNRTFASDRLQQHEVACRKANKQRRVFDSTKQRLEGTEAVSYYRKAKGGKGRNEPTKPQVLKSNWRQKHEDFIRSIRYAKQASDYERSGGRLADLPPPPVSVNPDYVQCPHCGRNYAPNVAERHIPKCVNIQNKPRPPPLANRTGNQQRMGPGNTGRAPISNYNSASGGFNNNAAYPPSNRSTRGGRY